MKLKAEQKTDNNTKIEMISRQGPIIIEILRAQSGLINIQALSDVFRFTNLTLNTTSMSGNDLMNGKSLFLRSRNGDSFINHGLISAPSMQIESNSLYLNNSIFNAS
jgi:hypothetical protein